jgi:4-amino-4-deoxy-L-arabinose transferase-like glycosyltransferase
MYCQSSTNATGIPNRSSLWAKHRIFPALATSLVLLIALAVRLHHLDYESLWMDELRQVSYYPRPFLRIPHHAATQLQPPLDYWIGHGIYLISSSDFAVRLPSALFGTGAILLLTLLAARIVSWPVAVVTGVIAALLPFNVYFSQEARPYSIALFFMLLVLYCLDRLLSAPKVNLWSSIFFFLSTLAFLYSRTLNPMVVTSILFLFLLATTIWTPLRGAGKPSLGPMVGACCLGLAILCAIPSAQLIIGQSDHFVSGKPMQFDMGVLVAAINRFDPIPLWEAFVVQTEPLTCPLLVLIVFSPLMARSMGLWSKGSLFVQSTLLLFCASLIDLFVFQAKATTPYRPPYAVHLLPMVLLLAGATVQGLWEQTARLQSGRVLRGLFLFLAAACIISTGNALWASKEHPKKTDWRGVGRLLSTSFGTGQLIIFDGLSPYGKWEPDFRELTRYYDGVSEHLSISGLTSRSYKFTHRTQEPVFVIFHWRNYWMTPESRYPIVPDPYPSIGSPDWSRIDSDPALSVTRFTGLTIIRLKKNSGRFLEDTYFLIVRLLRGLPPDSSVVDLHLAAASICRALGGGEWKAHLLSAEMLVPDEERRKKIRSVGELFQRMQSK